MTYLGHFDVIYAKSALSALNNYAQKSRLKNCAIKKKMCHTYFIAIVLGMISSILAKVDTQNPGWTLGSTEWTSRRPFLENVIF